jgi:hypothetical protein
MRRSLRRHEKFRIPELLLAFVGFLGIVASIIDNVIAKFIWETFVPKIPYFNQQPPSITQAILLTLVSAIAMFVAFERKTLFEILGDIDFLNTVLTLPYDVRQKINDDAHRWKKIMDLQKNDQNFGVISENIMNEQASVIDCLAEGRISVPIGLGIDILNITLDHFSSGFDAVSYDELTFWKNIITQAENSGYDWDFPRKYYNVVLSFMKSHKSTQVTRIFILTHSSIEDQDEKRVLANLLKKHMDDGIGVAVAFVENFSEDLRRRISTNLKRNFVLLNRDQAAIFFKREYDKFEVIFSKTNGAIQVSQQKQLHKALIVASTLGTERFQRQMQTSYLKGEWEDIDNTIRHLRQDKQRSQSESIFAVTLPDSSNSSESKSQNCRSSDLTTINNIVSHIENAIDASKDFGSIVRFQ